ncbi:hypothetical protein KXD93_22905 [Mucilaginibacter sp. BJC16-A38]|uniref:hypothetical protein n=1 Tax=Mucilaginibacter phenanthrenivorans TaxID=1234842 RepID=UPI0021573F9C|nr:hypothetical protein [Mucilaginibacter phenanthrenivorans]MCR8560522.1 hypothetical protein [Mucilaginibacter phenanthrenivorans]
MKKLTILSAIALSGLFYNSANAQIRVSVGLHLGLRPVTYVPATEVVEQAPVYDENDQVYDDSNDDDYYYLPDVDAYYNVNAQSYYYYNGDNWITCTYLPGAYRNYDWRSARRFEVHANRPYMRNDFYRSRYNGHEIAEWRNFNRNNHYGRDEHFNRDAYRGNDNRFDNRDNRFNRDAYRGNDNRFDKLTTGTTGLTVMHTGEMITVLTTGTTGLTVCKLKEETIIASIIGGRITGSVSLTKAGEMTEGKTNVHQLKTVATVITTTTEVMNTLPKTTNKITALFL